MKKASARSWKQLLDRYKYLAIVVLAGVVLLLIPSGGPESATGPPPLGEPPIREAAAFSVGEMEVKLRDALSQIEGVGRVSVTLTVAGSVSAVYAENERARIRGSWADGMATSQETDTERQVVMSSSSGGTAPVTESVRYPAFIGALIVCDGAEDPRARLLVAEAVSNLTGLPFVKIAIAPMRNGDP